MSVQDQPVDERIAAALERIADMLEREDARRPAQPLNVAASYPAPARTFRDCGCPFGGACDKPACPRAWTVTS